MILRRRGGARAGRAAPCSRAALALLCLASGAAAAQHRYVFDETVWTRGGWPALKLRFPVENFVEEQAEPAGYELLSSSGTYSQPELQRLQEAGRARRCAHAHPLCTFCVSWRPMWTACSRLHADRSSPAEWLVCLCRDVDSATAAVQDEAVSAELAGLMRCETCHALAAAAWDAARAQVHALGRLPPEGALQRLLQHSCQSQVRARKL